MTIVPLSARSLPRSSPLTIVAALLAVLLTMAALSTAWEFGIEKIVLRLLGLPDDDGLDTAERWRYVAIAVSFTAMSLILPSSLLLRQFAKLNQARRSLAEARLQAETLARHDTLTGLPNRRMFKESLQNSAGAAASPAFAALLVDLDYFKAVNDLHGHLAGDEVLIEFARLCRRAAPDGALVARLGGDEFGIILDGVTEPEPLGRLADQIISGAAAIRLGDGAGILMGATVGIAVAPLDGSEPEEIFRAADAALYRAKQSRGTYQFFEPELGEAVRQQAALRKQLKDAVAAEQIVPHYQPLIDLKTGRAVGFEVLARWTRHPEGPVRPDLFIPIAEEAGLIGALTSSILAQACRDAASWPRHLKLSVNLSPLQLKSRALPEQILATIGQFGFPPERLELEVTEGALIQDVATARDILERFDHAGVAIVLDDFGTGYSSLYHLRELPFTKIKIDRSFIRSLGDATDNRDLVDGILGLSRSLGIETTAEGVEEGSDADWLTRHGCNFGQGYLFGRAMSADEVGNYLKASCDSAAVIGAIAPKAARRHRTLSYSA